MDVKGERFDHALEAAKERARRRAGHRSDRRRPARARRRSSRRIVREDTGRDFPSDPYEQLDLAIKAVFASWFGKRAVDYRNNQKIAHDLGHRGQRRDDGLRQHGRRLGDRRRLHPRPEHRREGAVRRVPDQRPGRGRRRRHPDRAEDQPDADRHARGLRRVRADRRAAREALPRRPGPRVHDRARQALHAPDAESPSGPRAAAVKIAVDMVDRGRHHARKRRSAGSSRRHVDQLLARPVRPGGARQRRRAIAKGLNASPGAAVGRAVFDADTAVEWVEPRRAGRSWSGSRPRPTTSTGWSWPRGS